MKQKPLPEFTGRPFNFEETEAIIKELYDRTDSDKDGYNSIEELGDKTRNLEENKASQQNLDTESARITSLENSQVSGFVSFRTYAELLAYPTPSATEAYRIGNDPDPARNGTYHWIGGSNYELEAFTVENEIREENNVRGVSGKAVFKHIENSSQNISLKQYNPNNKWQFELVKANFLEIIDHSFISVNDNNYIEPTALTLDHPFTYNGNALLLKPTLNSPSNDFRLVLPNVKNNIKEDAFFYVCFEISVNRTMSHTVQVRDGANNVVGEKFVAFEAGKIRIVEIECVRGSNPSYFIYANLRFSSFNGSEIFIGRHTYGEKSGVLLNALDEEVKEKLIRDGLISLDRSLHPRNLLDVNKNEVELSFSSPNISPKPNINISYVHSNPAWNSSNPRRLIDAVAAEGLFDYVGNAMRIKLPDNGNCAVFFLVDLSKITQDLNSAESKFYYNFQVKSSASISVNISANLNGQNIVQGTNLGVVTVNDNLKVVNLEIDKEGLNATSKVGFRFIINANHNGEYIYIGKQVFSDVRTASVNLAPVNRVSPFPKVKKITEIGDSKVSQQQSLPKFIIATGNYYSTEEIDEGKIVDGVLRSQLGFAGSRIIPVNGSLNSIYNRAKDAHHYYIDELVIYGGANDPRNEFVQNGTWRLILGTINDEPYFGDGTELDATGYSDYWRAVLRDEENRDPNSPYHVTFASCYMGIIETITANDISLVDQVVADNLLLPEDQKRREKDYIKIHLQTVMIRSGGLSFQRNVWMPLNNLIKQIGVLYGCNIIDIANDAGINNINAHKFMDEDLVHENSEGGERIAKVKLKEII